MREIGLLRNHQATSVVIGSHPGIIQSVLDYDYLIGREKPSIVAIIASGRKQERYFWGTDEVMIPVVSSLDGLDDSYRQQCTAVMNMQSARRVLASTKQAIELLPNVRVVTIFAEQTPEAHSRQLAMLAAEADVLIVGAASVGVLLPGFLKLGAIGGTQYERLIEARITTPGDTAVISTSGGMVNELIHLATGSGRGVSFALALGGDRFPITDPVTAMLMAEADDQTSQIVYFGELGGTDEYEIAQLIDESRLTKRLIAYVAGEVAELFEAPPQFGHAGAIANTHDESAGAKKARLRASGAIVCDHLADMKQAINGGSIPEENESPAVTPLERKKRPIVSHVSGDKDGEPVLLGRDLLTTVNDNNLPSLTISLLLGRQVKSRKLAEFTDFVMRLLADHGPYVSGAVNTIVTARAGRDLVSGLSAGLLTIGPRFGGALNGAAGGWLQGVQQQMTPKQFVNSYVARGGIIPGIGHKKYRVDIPDPRIAALMEKYIGKEIGPHLQFALEVEKITTAKKGTLILNIDGAIAAAMLDMLQAELGYSHDELAELVDIEFFNALFVLARSIGLTAHYLDQRRYDEGLFRLGTDDVRYMEDK